MAICHILNTGKAIMEEEVIPFAPRSWVAGSRVDTGSVDAAPEGLWTPPPPVASWGVAWSTPWSTTPRCFLKRGSSAGQKDSRRRRRGAPSGRPRHTSGPEKCRARATPQRNPRTRVHEQRPRRSGEDPARGRPGAGFRVAGACPALSAGQASRGAPGGGGRPGVPTAPPPRPRAPAAHHSLFLRSAPWAWARQKRRWLGRPLLRPAVLPTTQTQRRAWRARPRR